MHPRHVLPRIKAAASGKVVVSAQSENGAVICTVHDNGAGIPLEMLAKVE